MNVTGNTSTPPMRRAAQVASGRIRINQRDTLLRINAKSVRNNLLTVLNHILIHNIGYQGCSEDDTLCCKENSVSCFDLTFLIMINVEDNRDLSDTLVNILSKKENESLQSFQNPQ